MVKRSLNETPPILRNKYYIDARAKKEILTYALYQHTSKSRLSYTW